jgi:hypothetical protein
MLIFVAILKGLVARQGKDMHVIRKGLRLRKESKEKEHTDPLISLRGLQFLRKKLKGLAPSRHLYVHLPIVSFLIPTFPFLHSLHNVLHFLHT